VLSIDFLSNPLPNLINLKAYSTTMKLFYALAVGMFFANGVIQMAAGLKCNSGCAACWLDNNSDGVDTKFICTGDNGVHCGDACPTGYNGIHCAKIERCLWVEQVAQKTNSSLGFQIGAIFIRLAVLILARVSAVRNGVIRLATYIAERSMELEHVRPPEPQALYLFTSSTIPKKLCDLSLRALAHFFIRDIENKSGPRSNQDTKIFISEETRRKFK
jgi:hypothetical protein